YGRRDRLRQAPAHRGLPEGPVAVWEIDNARRRLRARVPAIFSPVAGSRLLVIPVVVSILLTAPQGDDARGFAAAVPVAALPVWFRCLPVATLFASLALAFEERRRERAREREESRGSDSSTGGGCGGGCGGWCGGCG
ncbi:hypothetical protein ACWGIU_36680, partial [Streptomyces sp. NPDC054840]